MPVRRAQPDHPCNPACSGGVARMKTVKLSRRAFGKLAGAIVATFSLAPFSEFARAEPSLPVDLRTNRRLDGWIRIDEEGTVTIFTGKAELGQGILTALL